MSAVPRDREPAAAVPTAAPEVEVLPRLSERFSFALGDVASNLTWSTITSYLLFFYTDVALIAVASAGTLLLVARILDAVFDPAVGILLDRTNTRWGRARPFMMFGAPALAILTVLTFWTPGTKGALDLIWAYATFILVGIAYSAVNIPYGSLMTMVTRDSRARMVLASFRNAGAAGGLLIVSLATNPLVNLLGQGNARLGYLLTAAIYAAVGMVLFWVVSATTKERIPFEPVARQRGSLTVSLKALTRNRHWIAVFFAAVVQFARLGAITGGAIYYATDVLHKQSSVSIILLLFAISGLLASTISPWFLKLFGQRRGLIVSLIGYSIFTAAMLPAQSSFVLFLVFFFLASLIGSIGFVTLPALISDSVEYQDYITGQRSEGLLYSGYSFATKVGTALGSAFLAWGLALIGYTPTGDSAALSAGVAGIFIGLPIALAVLQIIALFFYTLERQLPSITDSLDIRRGIKEAEGAPSGEH